MSLRIRKTPDFHFIPSTGRYTLYKTYYPPANRKGIERGYYVQWLSYQLYLPIYDWFRRTK